MKQIKIVGIGGAGCNIIRNIKNSLSECFIALVNTDSFSLKPNNSEQVIDKKILIGEDIFNGTGAKGDMDLAYNSCKKSINRFKDIFKNTDILYLVAGLGGGTGSGVILSLAEEAKKRNICTIALVTLPLSLEGKKRYNNAHTAKLKLETLTDKLIYYQFNIDDTIDKTMSIEEYMQSYDKKFLEIIKLYKNNLKSSNVKFITT